jgi:hypothetical protein
MTIEIDNSDDLIDSRDVIAYLNSTEVLTDLEVVGGAIFRQIQALAAEGETATSDWTYGATLIRDSYFVEYARDLAFDCGLIPTDTEWPNTCIDWKQAARELQMDYTPVNFGGVTYWVR